MYLLAAIISYLMNAGVYVADKFLLSKQVHSSIVYTFYVGIWSVGNFALLLFAPFVPMWSQFFIDISAGLLFLFTLIFWYKALHQSEATRVVPIVGALTPIFSFILSYLFLGATLSVQEFVAFTILVAGGLLISIKRTRMYFFSETVERVKTVYSKVVGEVSAEMRPTRRLIINSVISAFFFAAYYVLIKYVYSHTNQPFIGAFVWSRLGSFIGVLAMLLVPAWRQLIFDSKTAEHRTPKQLAFFLGVRLTAAIAFIMLNWSVSLSDNVALINALQGTQYAFLLVIVVLLSKKFPKIIAEEIGRGVVLQKTIGVVLVCLGLYLLVL